MNINTLPLPEGVTKDDTEYNGEVYYTAKQMREFAEQALAQPAEAIPEGWKLVPIKPTQAMLDEMNLTGREGYDDVMGDGFSASLYHAAIISAPQQGEQT